MFNAITRTWKVYGQNTNGIQHRFRESFEPSRRFDWSTGDDVRIVEVLNSDKTGTNDYSIISVTRNTYDECLAELEGQLSDGLFENDRHGAVVEIAA